MILNSHYWENRYKTNDIGWDTGQITTPIKEYIDQIKDKSIKILIPGCGNGYEFDYLLNNGFPNIFVLDYAKTPLDNLSKRNPNFNPNHFIQSDFFEHQEQYDLIIEQTFFCALDPLLRAVYASKMNTLLRPKGKIIGLLFQFPLTEKGPPYGGSKLEYENLFSPYFKIKTLATAYNSIKPRQGNELFFIFEKKQTK
jgi:methyl halide transferase